MYSYVYQLHNMHDRIVFGFSIMRLSVMIMLLQNMHYRNVFKYRHASIIKLSVMIMMNMPACDYYTTYAHYRIETSSDKERESIMRLSVGT